jgi:hypothetical protein
MFLDISQCPMFLVLDTSLSTDTGSLLDEKLYHWQNDGFRLSSTLMDFFEVDEYRPCYSQAAYCNWILRENSLSPPKDVVRVMPYNHLASYLQCRQRCSLGRMFDAQISSCLLYFSIYKSWADSAHSLRL